MEEYNTHAYIPFENALLRVHKYVLFHQNIFETKYTSDNKPSLTILAVETF